MRTFDVECKNCGEIIEVKEDMIGNEDDLVEECPCCSCDIAIEVIRDEDNEDIIVDLFTY